LQNIWRRWKPRIGPDRPTKKTLAASDKAAHDTLPKFVSDGAEADASPWCMTVDLIFADRVLAVW